MWKVSTIFMLIRCIQGLQRNWDYTIISIFSNSSNEDLICSGTKVVRLGPGQYAVNLDINLNTDFNNDFLGSVEVYRSISGVGEYTKLPFAVSKQNLVTFMDTTYKDFIMKSVANCSNAPQFEGKWKGPMERKRYLFNKCTLDADSFPPLMQKGYYKIQFTVQGPVTLFNEALIKIEKRIY